MYMYLVNKTRVIDNETILKFAVVYFWKNYTCMKITHFVFFFMQMQGKMTSLFNDERVLMYTSTKHYMITIQ